MPQRLTISSALPATILLQTLLQPQLSRNDGSRHGKAVFGVPMYAYGVRSRGLSGSCSKRCQSRPPKWPGQNGWYLVLPVRLLVGAPTPNHLLSSPGPLKVFDLVSVFHPAWCCSRIPQVDSELPIHFPCRLHLPILAILVSVRLPNHLNLSAGIMVLVTPRDARAKPLS